MRNFRILPLSFFLFAVTASAGAAPTEIALHGGSDTGGGQAVVCRDSSGGITSVELLDLWEARVIYGRKIPSSSAPIADQVASAFDQLQNSFYNDGCYYNYCNDLKGPAVVRTGLDYTAESLIKAPADSPFVRRLHGAKLEKTNDAFEVVTPKDCEVDQVVRYSDFTDGDFVLIDQDLVDQMDATNTAALYAHEAFYSYLRSYEEKSSLRVRRSIGYVFGGGTFTPLESILPKNYFVCSNAIAGSIWNRAYFFTRADPNGKKALYYQVERANGLHTVGFSPVPFNAWTGSFEDLLRSSPGYVQPQPLGEIAGYDYDTDLWIGGEASGGKSQAELEFRSAPDQTVPNQLVRLDCVSH